MKVSFQMIGRTVMCLFISLLPVFAKIFEKVMHQCLNISLKMNFSQFASLVFFQIILALHKS